jgi:PhnB protein
MSIKGGKPNDRRVVPNLVVRDAGKALEFYKTVLGAEPIYVSRLPNGTVLHAQLRVGETVFLISLENMGMPEEQFSRFEQGMKTRSPETLKGTSTVLELYVDDVEETFRKAIEGGGRIKMQIAETFYGDRLGQFEDPFGHVWGIGQVVEELEPDEVDRRARERFQRA